MYRGKWSLAFAVLLPLLCLVTAVAYVVEPHLGVLNEGAANGAVLREPPQPLAYKVLLLGTIACAAGWFIHAFTGDPLVRRREQVKFAYFFVIASFAVLMIPPFVKSQALGSEPIGIVSGCVLDAGAAAQLRCNPDGGPVPRTGAQVEEGRPAAAASAADPATARLPAHNQWLVNIGGALRAQSELPCTAGSPEACLPGAPGNRVDITGGVVVPLPFVIVALFGGAVSLSRRVPEIQKRSEPGFAGTVAEPAIDARQAREELVFQIMQFASAPLIAITAYQVVEPASQAGAVALAFLAGFGSETILLMIRGVANGLQPRNVLQGLAAPGPAPTPAPAPAGLPGQGGVGPVAGFALGGAIDTGVQPLQLGIQAASDPPVEPVRVRLCVDDDLEAGSAALSVDGVLVGVPGDGCVEVPLAPGRPCRVEAHGRRAGREVHGGQTFTVNADDEARPLQIALA